MSAYDTYLNSGKQPMHEPEDKTQAAMGKGLVESLAAYNLPRNSQDILNQKQMVLAKIAQATNNPQIVSGLQEALSTHPDMIKHTLPVMAMQFPNLFEPDFYNRFDNKIFHPDPMQKQQMIAGAYKTVENDSTISRTQKAMIQDGLNRDGTLPPSYQ